MKIRIKNPIWGVPITALKYLCSDGLLHFEAPLKKKKNVQNHQIQIRKRQQGLVSQRQDTIFQNPHSTCTESSDSDTATTTRTCQSTARHHISESSYNVYKIVGATESEGKGFSNGLFDGGKTTQPLVNGNKVYKRIFIQRVN